MADDGRTYIRVHDGMPDHPKVDALSDKGFRLLIETWCWCSRHLTDGRVPRATWNRRGTPAARRELVNVGLVEDLGADGVQMHDYLEHQRSRAAVEEITASHRANRSRASAKANHQRWHVGPGKTPSDDCDLCPNGSESDTSTDPNRMGSRIHDGSLIGRGIGRGIGIPGVALGGEVPEADASASSATPQAIFDPENPRCGLHAHIAPGQPVPSCRDCAEIRRLAQQQAADEVLAEAQVRASWRAEVNACPDCDENGKRELPDGSLQRHHPHPSDRREAS